MRYKIVNDNEIETEINRIKKINHLLPFDIIKSKECGKSIIVLIPLWKNSIRYRAFEENGFAIITNDVVKAFVN